MPARSRFAVLMDPLETIKPAKDSTIAMLRAAAQRGCETLVFGQGDLWTRDGRAFARLAPIEVTGDGKDWFRLGEPVARELAGRVDAVLMRKDPPFDMEYICSTYLLERAEQAGVLVVNRPQGLRDMNEKAYTAWFPDCCAPTLITRDMAAMEAFLVEHGQAVFKPLDGMGGRSIFLPAGVRYQMSAQCSGSPTPVSYWYSYHALLADGQAASTGSPMTASPDNTQPVHVLIVQIEEESGSEVTQLVRESGRAWHVAAAYQCANAGNSQPVQDALLKWVHGRGTKE